MAYQLTVSDDIFGICKLDSMDAVPVGLEEASFYSLTRTRDEISLVCPQGMIPVGAPYSGEWRMIGIEGVLDFSLVGVLSSLLGPLAEAKISVFVVSTYNTDYVLVKQDEIYRAVTIFEGLGHRVRVER